MKDRVARWGGYAVVGEPMLPHNVWVFPGEGGSMDMREVDGAESRLEIEVRRTQRLVGLVAERIEGLALDGPRPDYDALLRAVSDAHRAVVTEMYSVDRDPGAAEMAFREAVAALSDALGGRR